MTAYKLKEAAEYIGMSKTVLLTLAENAGVLSDDNTVPSEFIDAIYDARQKNISFLDFASYKRNNRYIGSAQDRNKLLDYLELNEFFGITVYDPSELPCGLDADVLYFNRKDLELLESRLAPFFDLYGRTSGDITDELLASSQNKSTVICLRKYMDEMMFGKSLTPIFSEFITAVTKLPDLPCITDNDIAVSLKNMSSGAKDYMVGFLNYARRHSAVKYSILMKQSKDSEPIPAYHDDTYLALAKCLFNPDYIYEHHMIEKALENHTYAEMWLYLSIHYTCGWRAEDVCRGWHYLNLKNKPMDSYGINAETLYDDILGDHLPDKVYEDVCKYATKSIELSGMMPSKTNLVKPPALVISIAPELSTFFGLLTLIAEAVMIKTGDGYMKPHRAPSYQKKTNVRDFFGQEMYDALHGRNIQSRRLNKDFLQGIEETARQTGCGPIMASAVASFARSHNNLDTISKYLHDHAFNSENADMVLFFMMERGVFGFEKYQSLVTAFPDAVKQLPLKKQNEILDKIQDTPYQIELEQSGLATKLYVQKTFNDNNKETSLQLLKEMYEISQGRGASKDAGVHCVCRARGEVCKHPDYDSCLANACPYLVFTRYGYKALLEVISSYKSLADNGDKKAYSVLRDVIMPQFRDIINELMHDVHMPDTERKGLKLMMKEALE